MLQPGSLSSASQSSPPLGSWWPQEFPFSQQVLGDLCTPPQTRLKNRPMRNLNDLVTFYLIQYRRAKKKSMHFKFHISWYFIIKHEWGKQNEAFTETEQLSVSGVCGKSRKNCVWSRTLPTQWWPLSRSTTADWGRRLCSRAPPPPPLHWKNNKK